MYVMRFKGKFKNKFILFVFSSTPIKSTRAKYYVQILVINLQRYNYILYYIITYE